MKRSLTLACLLASATGVGSIASTSSALAQTASAPAESTALSGTPAIPVNPKIAIIAFQQAVAATNEGQRNFAQLRVKFEPKQTQLKSESDEIDSLKKQLQDAGSTLSEPERDSRLRTIDEDQVAATSGGRCTERSQQCDERHVSAIGTEGLCRARCLRQSEQIHPGARHQYPADACPLGEQFHGYHQSSGGCLQREVRRSGATGSRRRRHCSAPQHNQPEPACNNHTPQCDKAAIAVAAVEHVSTRPSRQESLAGREIITKTS